MGCNATKRSPKEGLGAISVDLARSLPIFDTKGCVRLRWEVNTKDFFLRWGSGRENPLALACSSPVVRPDSLALLSPDSKEAISQRPWFRRMSCDRRIASAKRYRTGQAARRVRGYQLPQRRKKATGEASGSGLNIPLLAQDSEFSGGPES